MSLDVYLTMNGEQTPLGSGIFVREGGENKEITRAEWDEKFPGREPVNANVETSDGEVYSANITHNLNSMAREAGIYEQLWRPDEIGAKKASQLIEPLRAGLSLLKSDPERFKKFNPSNGWGTYEGLVTFTENYLKACEEWPDAEVYASR
jgi:hypothetical protein